MEDAELLEVQLLKPAVFSHRCDDDVAVEIENRIFRSIDKIRSLCGGGNYKTLDVADFEMARNANTCALCPFRKVCVASLAKAKPAESEMSFTVEETRGLFSLLYPFHFDGTVKPLYLRLVWGELELAKVLEDTFSMSQLCWPVPNRCMRLPIDLKLCDDLLRATAGDADEEEAVYGGDELEMAEESELEVPFLR
jgi:hypothetical protein